MGTNHRGAETKTRGGVARSAGPIGAIPIVGARNEITTPRSDGWTRALWGKLTTLPDSWGADGMVRVGREVLSS